MSDDLAKRVLKWVGSNHNQTEAIELMEAQAAEIARLRAERGNAMGYLSRLLQALHPTIEPLPDLLGVCSQVDEAITGLEDEIARLRAALATARREGVEAALRLARHYEAVAYQHGDLPYMDPHECAAQAAREIASSIEAIIYSSVKDEPLRRVCDQCGVSLPANCPADEGYGCPACETHKELDEAAIRAAEKEGKP